MKTLNEELVKLGQAFGRNIREDVRTVKASLAGSSLTSWEGAKGR